MPKKYQPKSLLTKPQPSSPASLSSSRPSSASQTEASQQQRSVNDLIRESRRVQLRNEALRNPPPAAAVTTSSVHPSVRAVLDLPPLPPPPEPRRGVGALLGPARTRRIPGPPPPRSWLVHSIHAPPDKYHKSSSGIIVDGDGRRLQVRTSTLPGASFPPATSLQHLVLTKIASHWSWHALNDADWLSSLPSNLKQTLLSYLAVYNDSPINPIRLLFPEDVAIEDNDRDEIQRLDMGNALGLWTSMKGLERDLFSKNLSSSKPETSQAKSSPATPDHWDADQEDSDEYSATGLVGLGNGFSPKTRHSFVNLKHLSLAISPSNVKAASWASLLTVAGELGTLTSLSLAYWPQPTFTPNAASTRVTVRAFGQSVVYGGSNMYTAHDDDWREAAGILRTLSRSLYCLRWLDLTGCGDWYAALLWSPQTMALGDSSAPAERIGPEWNGGWRGLDKLVLQAGWRPVPPPFLSSSTSSPPPRPSTADTPTPQPDEPAWNVEHERMIYRYNQERQRLTDIHTRAREVANTLRRIRKGAGGKWIEVDCGESPTLSD